MTKDELLEAAAQELDYFLRVCDVDLSELDLSETQQVYDDIQQHLYDEASKTLEIVNGRPKPLVFRGYI